MKLNELETRLRLLLTDSTKKHQLIRLFEQKRNGFGDAPIIRFLSTIFDWESRIDGFMASNFTPQILLNNFVRKGSR
jgi:hypothetical protein